MIRKSILISSLTFVYLLLFTLKIEAQTSTPEPTIIPTVTLIATVTPTSVPTPTVVLPGVPQSVAATAISDDRIDITWKRASNATAYEVYRNNEVIAIISTLIYPDTGLDPETSYSYKVRSFDGSNYSTFSTNVSATTKEETLDTVNPTIPEGPEVEVKAPPVIEKFSYVTIDTVTYGLNDIPPFDAGEIIEINGKTESYADIELIVRSDPKSFYSKADEDGFWTIKIDTSYLEAGAHSFIIKITADDYPEAYESEEYPFTINEKVEEAVVIEEDNFGRRVRIITIVLIVAIVVIFFVLFILAKKKGWFKKLSGKGEDKSPVTPNDSTKGGFSEDMINIETEEKKSPDINQEKLIIEESKSEEDTSNTVSVPDEALVLETPVVTDSSVGVPVEDNVASDTGNIVEDSETETANTESVLGTGEPTAEDDSLSGEDDNVVHSMNEIDNDGIEVAVDDSGVNPYGEGIGSTGINAGNNMVDESDLPEMELSDDVNIPVNEKVVVSDELEGDFNSVASSNDIDEVSQPNDESRANSESRPLADYSSVTADVEETGIDKDDTDTMVSKVTEVDVDKIIDNSAKVEENTDNKDQN